MRFDRFATEDGMQAGIARFGRIILLGIVFGAILAFVGELVKPKRLDATPTRD